MSARPDSRSRVSGLAAALLLAAGCSANGHGGQSAAPAPGSETTIDSQVLLLGGRIGTDTLVLDPAFLLATRPVVPRDGGAHHLRGLDSAGTQLFELRFDGTPVADGSTAETHFSFALPLAASVVERLHRIELQAAGGALASRTATSSAAEFDRSLANEDVVLARRDAAGQVVVTWDATRFPAVMIRNPVSGQVLALGTAGAARVLTEQGELDVAVSNGVRSGNVRVVVR